MSPTPPLALLHSPTCHRLARQRGFTLLELSVSLAILGVILVVVVVLLDVSKLRKDPLQADPSKRAEAALMAYANTRLQLPLPDRQEPSPWPGYLLGSVPWEVLGIPDGGAVSYLVDARLTAAPAALYDPNKLGEGPGLAGAPSPASLMSAIDRPAKPDFCISLLRLQQSPAALPDGHSAAFLTRPPGAERLDQASGRGLGELAAALGCVDLLARLDGHIDALYATQEHTRLAGAAVSIDTISLQAAIASLVNDVVRAPIWGTKLVLTSIKYVEGITQALTSHDTGAAVKAATISPLAFVELLYAYGNALNVYFIYADAVGVEKAQAALASTQAYAERVNAELRRVEADLAQQFKTL